MTTDPRTTKNKQRRIKAIRATAGIGQVLYVACRVTPGDKYFVLRADPASVERMVAQADRALWECERLRDNDITAPGHAEIVLASIGITAPRKKSKSSTPEWYAK